MTTPTTPTTLIFGSSHAFFMAQCLGTVACGWHDVIEGPVPIRSDDGATVGHLVLCAPKVALFQLRSVGGGGSVIELTDRYAAQLAPLDQPENVCYFGIGGNEHNSLFMCRHATPFDFFDERFPGRLLSGRQIIPKSVISAHLQQPLQIVEMQLRAAAAALTKVRKVIVPPPLPIPSEAQVRSAPEGFDFERHALEDRWVRLKVWWLYADQLAGIAARLGAELRMPPAEGADAEGFLQERFWNMTTHAQPAYYRPMFFPA